jgi:hypothetical protein
MLYDPYRDLTILSMRDYAATKDPEESYRYTSRADCACAQFARHIGLYDDWSGYGTLPLWGTLNQIAMGHGAHDWTWGKLKERLDASL